MTTIKNGPALYLRAREIASYELLPLLGVGNPLVAQINSQAPVHLARLEDVLDVIQHVVPTTEPVHANRA